MCNFLNHMAYKVDLDSLVPTDYPPREKAFAASEYDPMRRKMYIVRN